MKDLKATFKAWPLWLKAVVIILVLLIAIVVLRKISSLFGGGMVQPTGVNTGGLSDNEKGEIDKLVNQLWNDVNGADYSLGFGKSNVIPDKIYNLSDDALYYFGQRFQSAHAEKPSAAIKGDYYIYFYPSDQDKHDEVVRRLQRLGF